MASAQTSEGAAAQRARLTPEDEDEWEYEYSTTETETFYVTLDLSTPDFTAPHKNIISNTRTDFHGKPLTEAERVRHKHYNNRTTGAGSEEEDEDEQRAQQQNQSREAGRSPDHDRAESDDDAESSGKVQIMELHSPDPVISYRGRVYQGQWSQNVGTELLMTRHDENDPLPAIRSLDDGIDLLAASCARITVTQKELERKDPESTEGLAKLTKEEREALAKIPKPDTKPSLARTNQTNFLAKLIALKKRKGEKDEVPVLVNGHVRDLWVKGSHRGRGRGGRPRGSGRRRDALRQEGLPQQRSALASVAELPNSTPTPRHWDDLGNANVGTHEGGGDGGGSSSADENAMEVDEGSNESGFSDEEGSMGEENGQEDEDEDGSGSDGQSDDEDSDDGEGDEMDVDED